MRNLLALDTNTYRPMVNETSPSQGLGAATQAVIRDNAFDVANISEWQLDARNRLAQMLGYTNPRRSPKRLPNAARPP